MKFWKKNLIIESILVGERIFIHIGNKFISLLIRKEMVGFKLGEFVFTKKLSGQIHIKKKKRKKK